MIIILLRVYSLITGLMTLGLEFVSRSQGVAEIQTAHYAFKAFVKILIYCTLDVLWLQHTFRRSYTIWIWQLRCVFKGDNLHVFGKSRVWVCWRLTLGFSWHHKCNKCQTLRGGIAHWASPVHYIFSDIEIISRSQQWQTTENYMFLSDYMETVGLSSASSRSWIYHYFWLSNIFKRDNWHVSDLTKTLSLAFSWTLFNFKWGFSNFPLLQPCLGSTSSYQVWWPWPCFKVTGVSES